MKKIAYYITAHGYGHGARSCDILNALHAAAPEVSIIAKTDLPVNFINSRLPSGFDIRPGAFDIGLIQKDSIQVDLPASLEAIEALYARENELIDQEAAFIKQEHIGVVVADIPAIPLAAAQQAGIPGIATGNFGWDWIYADFVQHDPRWQIYVDKFRRVYERTPVLLRQPFAEPMAAFPNQIDLPLLAEPGTSRKERIAKATGSNPEKPWILLSFTSLDLDTQALDHLARLSDYQLFTVDPLEWPNSGIHCLSRSLASFSDILASMDVVVTKPGFGILSECIANGKPMVYADRKNFLEYDILVENIKKYCRNAFIPAAELYTGNLTPALETIAAGQSARETMPRGGAALAAQHILHLRAS
jgi:L-arabinokinase